MSSHRPLPSTTAQKSRCVAAFLDNTIRILCDRTNTQNPSDSAGKRIAWTGLDTRIHNYTQPTLPGFFQAATQRNTQPSLVCLNRRSPLLHGGEGRCHNPRNTSVSFAVNGSVHYCNREGRNHNQLAMFVPARN